eukprot:TRINITY_DN14091_c0_g3_i8.p1 TRINITY_DN14091_c0_g3~~TRINITY_DN14091_c0_g3_i8.p1  ORF type:complete len:295 (-),score=54.15 TRINITY_DN14091_c0_g3_i8:117-1001(-)
MLRSLVGSEMCIRDRPMVMPTEDTVPTAVSESAVPMVMPTEDTVPTAVSESAVPMVISEGASPSSSCQQPPSLSGQQPPSSSGQAHRQHSNCRGALNRCPLLLPRQQPPQQLQLTQEQLASGYPTAAAFPDPSTKVVTHGKGRGKRPSILLWRRYGKKDISCTQNNPSTGRWEDQMLERQYYRCNRVGCPARLKMDVDKQSGNKLAVEPVGMHNHPVEVIVGPEQGQEPGELRRLVADNGTMEHVDPWASATHCKAASPHAHVCTARCSGCVPRTQVLVDQDLRHEPREVWGQP